MRSRRDDAVVEGDHFPAVLRLHLERMRRRELRLALDEGHLAHLCESGKALGELRDDAVLPGAQFLEVGLRRAERDAEVAHLLGVRDDARRVQQRLRRNAADVEADAAERRVALDEHDLLAEVGGAKCRGVAAGTRAEHEHFGVEIGVEARERRRERFAQPHGRRSLRGRRGRGRGNGSRRRRSGRTRGLRLARAFGFENEEHGALRNLVAELHLHVLHLAALRGRHFHRRLVALERDDRFVLADDVARLHEDLDHRDVLEIPDVGDLDLDRGHYKRPRRMSAMTWARKVVKRAASAPSTTRWS